MPRIFATTVSAITLALAGTALAQEDAYVPPAEEDTTLDEATAKDGERSYDEYGYEEPQGDANDDEGELIEPSEDQLEEDGVVAPGDPAVMPEAEELEGEDDAEFDPEL